jgi:hypothetical protein
MNGQTYSPQPSPAHRDARALLAQLADYRARWPEIAADFERTHAAGITAARALVEDHACS